MAMPIWVIMERSIDLCPPNLTDMAFSDKDEAQRKTDALNADQPEYYDSERYYIQRLDVETHGESD